MAFTVPSGRRAVRAAGTSQYSSLGRPMEPIGSRHHRVAHPLVTVRPKPLVARGPRFVVTIPLDP